MRFCRFQFRLRTLLVGAILFCVVGGWFGQQYRLVRKREALLSYIVKAGGFYVTRTMHIRANQEVRWADLNAALTPTRPHGSIAQIRECLGDEPIKAIGVPSSASRLNELRTAFPEADFAVLDGKK